VALDHLSGGAKPPGRTVCHDVDHPGLRWTGSRMENPAFTRVNLSNVRVIMAIMRILMVELAMLGDDEMNSSTQVLVVRCMWAPVATSCRTRY
jgi:hypothetical protein